MLSDHVVNTCELQYPQTMRKRKPLDPKEHGRRAGKARLKVMTPEERQRVARLGAKARWNGLSKAERSEAARKAVQARWAKAKFKKG